MTARRPLPFWVFAVVPMVLAALLVGAVSIAVRSGGDDDDGDDISGPAAGLPAVVDAAAELRTTTDGEALGEQYGTIAAAYGTITDEVDFAAQFDRLPDAEARLLGRTLGTIQGQLSPTEVGGARGDDDRAPDIVYALELARGMVQALDPSLSPRDQALAVLPFAVQDLQGFDALAEQFATGDLTALAATIDATQSGETGDTGALSEGGAAEVVSSVAFLLGKHLPEAYQAQFDEAYQGALPL